MSRFFWLATAAAMLILPARSWAQQQDQQGQQQASGSQGQAQPPAQSNTSANPASQQDPLAAAARKAREQKKDAPKATKVFDNDSIPTQGGISTVGAASAPPGDNAGAGAAPASGNDEKTWRERFATLHHKLDQDQAELDVLQRELGVANVQFYNDPVKEMQQKLTNEDINKKLAAIDAKKKAIEADKQAISDAEEELRKAGGDSGWAR